MLAVKSTASLHCLLTLIILDLYWLRWNRQPLKPTSFLFQVSAWGGYVFIINLIPLHVFVLLLMNRYSERIYVAYNTFFIIGLLCSMQIPFVGFQPVKTSEHMASAGKEHWVQCIGSCHLTLFKLLCAFPTFLTFVLGVFALLQAVAISNYLRNFLTKSEFKYFFFLASSIAAGLVFLTVVGLTWAGVVAPWSGR